MRGGREIQPPGTGSVAAALVIDTSGRARIVPPDSIQAVRVRAGISEALAALMGALGCRSAVLLDGGIFAQLAVRDSDGARREWKGMRMVPLGILVTRREPGSRR